MKSFLLFLLGVIAGAYGCLVYQRVFPPVWMPPVRGERTFSDKARDQVSHSADVTAEKLKEWHLTSDDIRRDLDQSGEIVRSRAHAAGVAIADARVEAVIKAKYVLDHDLSAIDIRVEANDGQVTLTGTVATRELVARAVALALDTTGVHQVTARLKVS